jgi:nucleoside-diphosphate-sugar epimerase
MNVLDGTELKLTGGEQARDFIFVDDVTNAFLSAGVIPEALGETFNISTGKATSVKELVTTIIDLMKAKDSARPIFGALPYRSTEQSLSGNPAKAKKKLEWAPEVPLEVGLKKTIEWFNANRKRFPIYNAKSMPKGVVRKISTPPTRPGIANRTPNEQK